MTKLTLSKPTNILTSGLGKLAGQLSIGATIMTRILSVFNLLKRVGFVFLVLGSSSANSQPTVQWSQIIGGPQDDLAYDVIALQDGSSFVVGQGCLFDECTESTSLLIKLNDAGDTLWTRSYDSIGYIQVNKISEYLTHGFLITGTNTNSDFCISRLDSSGIPVWTSTPEIARRNARAIALCRTDGNIIAVTGGGSSPLPDITLLHLDSQGDTIRTTRFGGIGFDYAYDLEQLDDNRFVVAGLRTSSGPAHDLDGFVLVVDSLCNEVWSMTFGWPESDEWITSIELIGEDSVVCAGWSESIGGTIQPLIVALHLYHDTLWTHTDENLQNSAYWDISVAYADQILCVGTHAFDQTSIFLCTSVSRNGSINWSADYGQGGMIEHGICSSVNSSGEILLSGWIQQEAGDWGIKAVKLNSLANESTPEIIPTLPNIRSIEILPNFPNPFSTHTLLPIVSRVSGQAELNVYNVLGQNVVSTPIIVQRNALSRFEINGMSLPNGIYIASLEYKGNSFSRLIQVVK